MLLQSLNIHIEKIAKNYIYRVAIMQQIDFYATYKTF